MLLIGHIFPNSGIIKECDNDYESNDDILCSYETCNIVCG